MPWNGEPSPQVSPAPSGTFSWTILIHVYPSSQYISSQRISTDMPTPSSCRWQADQIRPRKNEVTHCTPPFCLRPPHSVSPSRPVFFFSSPPLLLNPAVGKIRAGGYARPSSFFLLWLFTFFCFLCISGCIPLGGEGRNHGCTQDTLGTWIYSRGSGRPVVYLPIR